MKTHLIIALKITFTTIILFGVIYPIIISGIAKYIGPNNGKGETITVNGKVVGFELIGQKFDNDNYFNGRPSAVDYNAASTGGSNKGPSNPDYLAQVQARIDTFLVHNPSIKKQDIPVDLITASGGGLDPHISVQAALVQIPRIAKVRGVSEEVLRKLVAEYTSHPLMGIAPTTVHVLNLNLAVDQLQTK